MDAALRQAIEDVGRTFEQYKSENDKRLEAIEKGQGTAELEEKVKKIDDDLGELTAVKEGMDTVLKNLEQQQAANDDLRTELDELVKKSQIIKPGAPGAEYTPEEAEYRKHFNAWLRKNLATESDALFEAEKAMWQSKALTTTAPADGGHAIPPIVDRQLIEVERPMVPMRGVCGQITVGSNDYSAVVNLGGAATGWVGENDLGPARPETGTPKLGTVSANMGELYAMPGSTQTALDDMMFDAEQWLIDEVSTAFAETENAAFTGGDGTNKPRGLWDYPTAATDDYAGTRPFGTFEHIVSGAVADIQSDDLIDLVYACRAGYRQQGRFMMANQTVPVIRKLKTTDGQYLWQPGLKEGEPNRLIGYSITENEAVPTVATGAKSVAFGDFRRAYTVVDRIGTRLLRDPYTVKGKVLFYMTRRVGGFGRDSLAVKFLQIQ